MAEIKIQLQSKQRAFQRAVEEFPVVFFGGAKGGGKSYGLRNILLILLSKYEKSKGLLIRKTYDELVSNHIEQMFKENPDLFQYYNAGDKMLKLPNGSILRFRHLQHPSDVYNYQGQEFDFIGIDELTQHEKEIFTILRSSNRTTDVRIKPRMILTGNPGGIGHGWVKRLFIDKDYEPNEDPKEYTFVSSKVKDNQVLMDNDPDYIKRLEALPEDLRKAYLEGDWDIFKGQYFGEWRRELHTCEPHTILPHYKKFICGDYGFAAPSAVYWCYTDNDGRVFVYRELYKSGLTFANLAKEIIRMTGNETIDYWVFDPSIWAKKGETELSGVEIMEQTYKDVTKKMIIIQKGNNDRINGWGVFREHLKPILIQDKKTTKLQIFNTCREAIRTIPGLIYDEHKVEDLNSDGEDHAADSIRYGLMSRPKASVWYPNQISALLNKKQIVKTRIMLE